MGQDMHLHTKSSHQFRGLSSTATPVQGPRLRTESLEEKQAWLFPEKRENNCDEGGITHTTGPPGGGDQWARTWAL